MKWTTFLSTLLALLLGLLFGDFSAGDQPNGWQLTLRSRTEAAPGIALDTISESTQQWNPRETAVIVCDMWDAHHCFNATGRVKEMAPRMNDVLRAARDDGVLIIHAPSSCMPFYADHPARQRAQEAPRAKQLPEDIASWCHWKDDREQETGYPINHADGGEDDEPDTHSKWQSHLTTMKRNPRSPWIRQIDLLEIDPDRDAISDSGIEIWNLLEDRGIENVILVGVHANMCVLGRPFGLRQMARNGKNVVLMRDMTDTMYNPARFPYVSHFRGTDMVVGHIEKLVCPTITSDQLLGGSPFRFQDDRRPNILVAIAEPEYETDVTLPKFAEQTWRQKHGYNVKVLIGDANKHDIPGFAAAVKDADVVVLSIRRQALPGEGLAALRTHLQAGKPLLAIRTSSHAFDARGRGPEGHAEWTEFDPEVLGGNYHGHHPVGSLTAVSLVADSAHPILRGIRGEFTSQGSLYEVSPLASSTQVLLMGAIADRMPEPVAWVNTYGPNNAKVCYTSLGHESDFENPQFRRLLDNAMRWMIDARIPLTLEDYQRKWHTISVPRWWHQLLKSDALVDYDGFAWYRCQVHVPAAWKGKPLTLELGNIDDCDETFFNGTKVGATGRVAPEKVLTQPGTKRRYVIPAEAVNVDQWNTIAVRTFDDEGNGGMYAGPLGLSDGAQTISLQGTWEFRVGDRPSWADAVPTSVVSHAARFN